MKNRGFGLGAMICLCGLLGICIFASAFTYQELVTGKKAFLLPKSKQKTVPYQMKNDYSGVSLLTNNEEYSTLERRLQATALTYIETNAINEENKIIITLRTLQNKKIIDAIYDSSHNLCKGYVICDIPKNSYLPYIRCGNYKTIDYIDRLE